MKQRINLHSDGVNTEKTEEKSHTERIASFLDQMRPMFPNPHAAAELRRLHKANKILHQTIAQTEQENEVYEYAKRLAEFTCQKHFKDVSPNWKPLGTVLGVLTQIDNMTCGLEKIQPKREWKNLTKEELIEIGDNCFEKFYGYVEPTDFTVISRAVEAKLKEKNYG